MTLQERLSEEMKQAMKSGDQVRLSVVRLLQAAIKNRQIAQGKAHPLSESDLMEILVAAVKQRREAIEQYHKAGRADLVEKEQQEMAIVQEFLPPALTDEELDARIEAAIRETGASAMKDMGRVMKMLIPQILGRADNAKVSERVKARLNR